MNNFIKILKNNKKIRIFFLVIFSYLYLMSTDSFWTSVWKNNKLSKLSLILIVLVGFCFLAFTLIFKINFRYTKSNLFLLIIIFNYLLSMIINKSYTFGYILKLSFLFFGLFLLYFFDIKELGRYFIKILVFISLYSLIMLFFYKIKIIDKNFNLVENYIGAKFYNGIVSLMYFHGDTFIRNWGPFWEPGVFQAYLIVALIIDLFLLKNKKPYNLLIFSVTIYSTFSTTGIICLNIIFVVYLLYNFRNKEYYLINIFIFLLLLSSVITVLSYEKFRKFVFSKLIKGKDRSSSMLARLYSIPVNLKIIFSKNLFFGTGIERYNEIYVNTLLKLGYESYFSNTNSILNDGAKFGVLILIFDIYLFIKLSLKFGENKKILSLVIFLIFIILLSTEDFSWSLFFMTLPFFSFDKNEVYYENFISYK